MSFKDSYDKFYEKYINDLFNYKKARKKMDILLNNKTTIDKKDLLTEYFIKKNGYGYDSETNRIVKKKDNK